MCTHVPEWLRTRVEAEPCLSRLSSGGLHLGPLFLAAQPLSSWGGHWPCVVFTHQRDQHRDPHSAGECPPASAGSERTAKLDGTYLASLPPVRPCHRVL